MHTAKNVAEILFDIIIGIGLVDYFLLQLDMNGLLKPRFSRVTLNKKQASDS